MHHRFVGPPPPPKTKKKKKKKTKKKKNAPSFPSPPPPQKKNKTKQNKTKKHLVPENSQNCLIDGVKCGCQAFVRHPLSCFSQVNSHFLSIAHRHTG